MFIKVLIVSVILLVIAIMALGIKLFFKPRDEIKLHTCAFEDGTLNEEGACSKCDLKDIADCPEQKDKKATQ